MPKPNIFKEIAKRCKVSPATVTLALQDSPRIGEDTKYRVYLMARELNYRHSKTKRRKHLQFAIFHGMILPLASQTGSTQFEIWYGVTQAINKIDASLNIYEVKLQDGEWSFPGLPSSFKRDQIDGVIVTGTPGKEFLDFLVQIKMPVIVASNADLSSDVDQICFDYARVTRMALEAALARGKRRIGFISPGSKLITHQTIYQQYENAMREADCFDEQLVAQSENVYDHEGKLMSELLTREPKLEVILTTNPRTAHQAALIAALKGVPTSQLEIITSTSELHRELIYPQHLLIPNYEEFGRSAVKRLLDHLEKPGEPTCTIMLQCRYQEDPAIPL